MKPMEFVKRGHLGGYVKSDGNWPDGDPFTFCPKVWDRLVGRYGPRTVLDVGCGEGHAVRHFRRAGIQAFGIDGCHEALEAGIADREWLFEHDYSNGVPRLPFQRVDLVWCCEFVEHVEAVHEENFLATFDLADVVCMTHAFPGQGGHHHVNCRPAPYWTGRMAGRGFTIDAEAVRETRTLDGPDGHWARSGLVFVKTGARSGLAGADAAR